MEQAIATIICRIDSKACLLQALGDKFRCSRIVFDNKDFLTHDAIQNRPPASAITHYADIAPVTNSSSEKADGPAIAVGLLN